MIIENFEEYFGCRFPDSARILLKELVGFSGPKRIKFDGYNWGQFQVLDFGKVGDIERLKKTKGSTISREEILSNPFWVTHQIKDFIKSNVESAHPLHILDLVPFARSTWADEDAYIYFTKGRSQVLFLGIGWLDSRPKVIAEDIESLMGDMGKLIEEIIDDREEEIYRKSEKQIDDLISEEFIYRTVGFSQLRPIDLEKLLNDLFVNIGLQEGIEDFGVVVNNQIVESIQFTHKQTKVHLDFDARTYWIDRRIMNGLNGVLTNLYSRTLYYFATGGSDQGLVFADQKEREMLEKYGIVGNWNK